MHSVDLIELTHSTIAEFAMEDLLKLTLTTENWIPCGENPTNFCGVKSAFESKLFVKGSSFNMYTEETRVTGVVDTDISQIISTMMNPDTWAKDFPEIVARVSFSQKLVHGNYTNYDGTMWKIGAAFHLLSPLIPLRKMTFIRSCRGLEDGRMAVADVSIANPQDNARRLPSGLLVKSLGIGKSEIVWIERTEYNRTIVPQFQPAVQGFSANRFLALLKKRGELSTTAPPPPPRILTTVHDSMEAFCKILSSATWTDQWTVLHSEDGDDGMRILFRPLTHTSNVVSFTFSIQLPFEVKEVFECIKELHLEDRLESECGISTFYVIGQSYGWGISDFTDVLTGVQFVQRVSILDDGTSILIYVCGFEDHSRSITSGFVVQNTKNEKQCYATVSLQQMYGNGQLETAASRQGMINAMKEKRQMLVERIIFGLPSIPDSPE